MNWAKNYIDGLLLTVLFFLGSYLFNSLGLQIQTNSLIILTILFLGYSVIAFFGMTLIRYLRGETVGAMETTSVDRYTKKFVVAQFITLTFGIILVYLIPPAGNFIVAQPFLIQLGLLGVLEGSSVLIADKIFIREKK
jgi:hypothetical protein